MLLKNIGQRSGIQNVVGPKPKLLWRGLRQAGLHGRWQRAKATRQLARQQADLAFDFAFACTVLPVELVRRQLAVFDLTEHFFFLFDGLVQVAVGAEFFQHAHVFTKAGLVVGGELLQTPDDETTTSRAGRCLKSHKMASTNASGLSCASSAWQSTVCMSMMPKR